MDYTKINVLYPPIGYTAMKIDGTDNTSTFQALINYVSSIGGGKLFLPKGEYKVDGHIDFKSNVHYEGIPELSIIYASDNVTCSNFGWLTNDGYGLNYNASTVNTNISFYGITFDWRRTTSLGAVGVDPHIMLSFGNIRDITFKKCNFIALNALSNQGFAITPLDFCGSWKNVTLRDCKIDNRSNGIWGGGIWIRNAATIKNDDNICENFLMENCKLYEEERDELLAIFTSNYTVRNVRIKDCEIHKAIAAINGNVPITIGATNAEDILEDVEVTGCKIIADDFIHQVMHINSLGTVKNIQIHHNTFYAKSSVDPIANNTALITQDFGQGCIDVCVHNNYFYVLGTNDIQYGFLRVTNGYENYINGLIRIGFQDCVNLDRNEFASTSSHSSITGLIATSNTKKIKNNTITGVHIGIKFQYGNGDTISGVLVDNNDISLLNINGVVAFYFKSLSGSFTAKIKLTNNNITTINTGSKFVNMDNNGFSLDFIDNVFTGLGNIYRAANAPTFRFCRNNDWNIYNDSMASTLPSTSTGLLSALPLGHEIRKNVVGTATKFVRTAITTGDATDWVTLTNV
jgi:hypothetical protein